MDISREEFYICSEPAPLRLHTAIIAPKDCQPSACLQIVHGMSEHKERYYPFMEYLAEKGFACIINDVRGHGKVLFPLMTSAICMTFLMRGLSGIFTG